MAARQLSSQRGGVLYADPQGFIFNVKKNNTHTLLLKCVKKGSFGCMAGGTLNRATSIITGSGHHNHDPDNVRIMVENLKAAVRGRVVRERTEIQIIFNEECVR